MTVIRLRGHHLFCLMGYRGKGYSDGFCANMTSVYETLRSRPDTTIELIEGPDDICAAFPSDQPSHCQNRSVYQKDHAIIRKLGLETGSRFSWETVCSRAAAFAKPEDVRTLCRDCRWQPLGLCEEGVGHIVQAGSLRRLPGPEPE